MICAYCGTKNDEGEEKCKACGAPIKKPEYRQNNSWLEGKWTTYENGYIVVTWFSQTFRVLEVNVQFWLGDRLIDWFSMDNDMLSIFVPEGAPFMPFFWDLFELSQGKRELIRIKEQNQQYPSDFVITKIENEQLKSLKSFDRQQLYELTRKL